MKLRLFPQACFPKLAPLNGRFVGIPENWQNQGVVGSRKASEPTTRSQY